jgi:ribonuclease HI
MRRTQNEDVPAMYKCKLSILTITTNARKPKRQDLRDERWTRPEPRVLKVNVDASFYVDDCAGLTGAVIRDFEGRLVATCCVMLPHVSSVAMAEAHAMKEGLALAERLGCNRIIAESNSSETIEAFTGEQRWWNEPATIYAECIDKITNIGEVSFKLCPREVNQVAHELASYSYSNKISCTWDDDPLASSLIGS